jgi:hypothetical protein
MATPAAARASAELEKQLVELSRLRNANTRDPDFKVWRQGTLTLIQRLWEGDDSRSGRFRAVPFSPSSTLADAKMTRECFERGCAEAAHVIRDMIEEINAHGIVRGPGVSFSEPEPLPEDESVPILSLDSSETGTGHSSIPDEPDDLRLSDDVEDEDEAGQDDDELLEIPDPPGARQPKPVSRPIAKGPARATAPESPRPPAVKPPAPEARASATAQRPSETQIPQIPQIPPSETAAPGPSRGVTVSGGGSAKPNKKIPLRERLLDMLGFEPGSKYSPPAQQKSKPAARGAEKPQPPRAEEKPQPPPRVEAKPQPPRAEEPPRPAAQAPPPLPRPTPTHSPRPAAPVQRAQAPRPQPPGPPPIAAPRDDSLGTIASESIAPLSEGGVSEDFGPAPRPAAPRPTASRPATRPNPAPPVARVPAARPEPPREEPRHDEPPPESEGTSEYDEERLRRAFEAALESVSRRQAEPDEESGETEESEAEDLLESSPVFNVPSRPAHRRGRELDHRYHTATSIAMAAIASEVEAMGVPAEDCTQARTALLELADHFERRDLTWDTVRDAVRLLVEYPVVARRVLPLLVPHLDEAA